MTKEVELYAQATIKKPTFGDQLFLGVWTILGLSALFLFAWREPFSGRWLAGLLAQGTSPFLVNYVLTTLIMLARAFVMGEVLGYVYHRYFQHLGFATKVAKWIRRNQRSHWAHHMVTYPIGPNIIRKGKYISVEPSFASWIWPILFVLVFFLLTMGFAFGTFIFVLGLILYYKLSVEIVHGNFHIKDHSWFKSRYFRWVYEIHILHHWNHDKNFTILYPGMDMLFGTYMSPRKHQKELRESYAKKDLSASDIINWGILLIRAWPAEYAAYISHLRKNDMPVIKKIIKLRKVLQVWVRDHKGDAHAKLLYTRAGRFLKEI